MSNEAMATWGGVLVTLVISIWSLVVAKRAQRAADDDRNAREAARVSAWVAAVWSQRDPDDISEKSNVLVIRNASDAAIHDIEASAEMNGKTTTFTANICPPGESYARWNPPGSKFTWQLLASCAELTRTDHGINPYSRNTKWQLRTLKFTDALGTRWEYVPARGVVPVPNEASGRRKVPAPVTR